MVIKWQKSDSVRRLHLGLKNEPNVEVPQTAVPQVADTGHRSTPVLKCVSNMLKKKVLFLLQLKARDVATLTDYAESCGRSLSAMLKPCELELLTVTVVLVPFGAMEEIIWWISLLYIYAVTYTNSPFSGTLLNFWGIWFNLIIYTYSILYFLYKRTPYPIKWEHWGNA